MRDNKDVSQRQLQNRNLASLFAAKGLYPGYSENIIDSRTLEIRPEINETIEKRRLINNHLIMSSAYKVSPNRETGDSDISSAMLNDKH